MEWIFALVLAPAMFAAVNHIDGHLLNQQSAGKKALIVFSGCIGIIAAFIIYLFIPKELFDIDTKTIWILLGVGVVELISISFYIYALEEEETSLVAPLMQMISVLGLIFGYFIFSEIPTFLQLIGAVLIILSGIFLNINEEEGKKVFNKKVFFLMIGATTFFALGGILFKFVIVEPQFWVASFWHHLGLGVSGSVLLVISGFRKEFKDVFKKNTKAILGFSALNEILNVSGNLLLFFALLVAPVGLVYLGESVQPMFVLVFGVLLAKFLPNTTNENFDRDSMIKKTIAIIGIVLGGILVVVGV